MLAAKRANQKHIVCIKVLKFIKAGSHMSPMIGESLSVIIQGENSQRILLMSNHRQQSSPMSATYENQA